MIEEPTKILFELKAVVNLIKRQFEEQDISKDLAGITGMQGWIIAYLYRCQTRNQDVFQRDIKKEFNIRRSTVTRLLQRMEHSDLIIRESVAYDARLKRIRLTAKSRRIHERVSRKILAVEKKLCQDLDPDEIEAFMSMLSRMKENVEA